MLCRDSVIQHVLDATGRGTYIEIGVYNEDVFKKIKSGKKIAVDSHFYQSFRVRLKKHFTKYKGIFYFEMASDDFFQTKAKSVLASGIDVAFIDGLHTYDQSRKDVENCLKYLNNNGTIIMHDCSPTTHSMAYPAKSFEHAESLNLEGWTREWCGDVWKTIVELRSTSPDLEVSVLDTDYGIGIIRRGRAENMLPPIGLSAIRQMSYLDLERNRKMLLNLKSPGALNEVTQKLEDRLDVA